MILFIEHLKTLHITGPCKVSGPLIRCDAEDILPAHWLVFPPGPLCPRRDVTQAKHKAVFHGAAAYLASESMWDMPGNKGASLRQLTGWAYPFHGPHIPPPPPRPCSFWRTHGGFHQKGCAPGGAQQTTWTKCKNPSDTTVRTQINNYNVWNNWKWGSFLENLLAQLNLWKQSRFEFLNSKLSQKM